MALCGAACPASHRATNTHKHTMNKSTIVVGVIAVIALVLWGWAVLSPASPASVLVGNIPGNTLSPTGVYLPNPTVLDFLETRIADVADKQFMLGGATVTTGIDQVASIGSCTGVTATSTLFSITNPFAATSTVTFVSLYIGGNATTSTLTMGTSTASTLGSPSASLIGGVTLATSTTYYISGGVTVVSSPSQLSPGASAVRTMVVGPSQTISAVATSTATGAGAAQYSPNFTTCSYKLKWEI